MMLKTCLTAVKFNSVPLDSLLSQCDLSPHVSSPRNKVSASDYRSVTEGRGGCRIHKYVRRIQNFN